MLLFLSLCLCFSADSVCLVCLCVCVFVESLLAWMPHGPLGSGPTNCTTVTGLPTHCACVSFLFLVMDFAVPLWMRVHARFVVLSLLCDDDDDDVVVVA